MLLVISSMFDFHKVKHSYKKIVHGESCQLNQAGWPNKYLFDIRSWMNKKMTL